jgi:pilus assembly protein CpaB
LKRSSRLILLIGIFLAIIAFVGIILILQGGGGGDGTIREPEELPTVYAQVDIPLGTVVLPEMVVERVTPVDQRDATAFSSVSLVIGKIAREDVIAGAQLTADTFATQGAPTSITVPPGLRAISVQVDQVTGVGTLIRTGDYVDVLVGFQQFKLIQVDPETEQITPVPDVSPTTVKLLLQGLQVVGTLLPPPPADTGTEGDGTTDGGTALTGQQEIVVLAGTAQQVEVIKYAQLDGNVSLVLRSPVDFRDPNDPTQPIVPAPDVTTGVILKTLVDEYGVLVPQLVEAILPAQASPAP